jgi:GrpB-like predicted nucleotidyltransferase (UPF0157 family)
LPPDEIERMPQLIEIVPPREEWREDFATLKRAVMRAAPDGAYIHHIGSTAVPDLPAKDTIDLQLTVDSLACVVTKAVAGVDRDRVGHGAGLVIGERAEIVVDLADRAGDRQVVVPDPVIPLPVAERSPLVSCSVAVKFSPAVLPVSERLTPLIALAWFC